MAQASRWRSMKRRAAIATATADMGMVQAELVQIAARTPAARAAEAAPAPAVQPQRQAPNLAPAVAAWISKNDSWFNKDSAKTKLALSLHPDKNPGLCVAWLCAATEDFETRDSNLRNLRGGRRQIGVSKCGRRFELRDEDGVGWGLFTIGIAEEDSPRGIGKGSYWKRVVQTAALAGFQVVRGSACLLRDPFWIETPVGYS